MKVGDKVNYVPAECHARIPAPTHRLDLGIKAGDYPWVFGYKSRNGQVEELTTSEVRAELAQIKKTRKSMEQHGLLMLRPCTFWPAVVTAIDGDNVTLDVDDPNPCVTLHVTVKVDQEGKTPHTCHEISKQKVETPVLSSKPPKQTPPQS